ncbi:unnamed protein product [Discosporangium mesarthrocarpum]
MEGEGGGQGRRGRGRESLMALGLDLSRRLQAIASFERLDLSIIVFNMADVEALDQAVARGVGALNSIFKRQDASTGISSTTAWFAEGSMEDSYVATGLIPTSSVVVQAPEEVLPPEGDTVVPGGGGGEEEEGIGNEFLTSTQFLLGAGLVVVVSFMLSIAACIVFWMKRKARKETENLPSTPGGEVISVDPWASLTSQFTKQSASFKPQVPKSRGTTTAVTSNGGTTPSMGSARGHPRI